MTALPSEQVIIESPMSFTGSGRRLYRWLHPHAAVSAGWRKAFLWTALVLVVILAWAVVLAWYLLLAAFGLIPLAILIIFRLTRRARVRGEIAALRHRELLRQGRA